ncbi:AfsR/SARP family transcriptional regulator [Actinomadura oligospora]|uniref:AfsR/SARP family transcriptional regulator n=1 Tax=Actinomadura oligospora TaxID=111804 RepID=UPI0006856F6A|nr:AfsR/SARP family transcriptional regulator [Actinomadura oligospora]
MSDGGRVRILILGPIEVWRGGDRLQLGGAKQRTLLAGLALHAGRHVAADQIIDWLWGEEPPTTAGQQLHKQVSQLRSLLGTGSIERHARGYTLHVEPDRLDLAGMEAAARAGRAHLAEGRVREAAERFRAALRTWRGRSIADAAPGLSGAENFLEERRLTVALEWADAELRLGGSAELVAGLRILVAEHPCQERLWAQLILALYRAGRGADALAAYEECRGVLADRLGLDPGVELRTLHHAMLTGDPSLNVGAPEPESPQAAAVPRPVNLPAAIGDFTGRETQRDWIRARLARGAVERPAVPVLVICGQGGVGKTALALQVAHDVEPDYPDGRLYVNLRGHDARPADPIDVLHRFLHAVGVDDSAMPHDPDEAGELFRSRTAGRRMLFVLDNAAGEAQVRPLLPGSPSCSVLVTSRSRLSGLSGAQTLNLEVFSPQQAVGLLEAVVGAERVAAELDSAHDIARLCGHLPLAVRIAAARLASRPHWPLARLVERLRDQRRRLNELAFGDMEVRASVALGYQGLSEPQRRAFRMLGLIQVPDFAAWTLAPLLGVPVAEAEDLIDALIDARLLEVARSGPGGRLRLRFHDLVLLYARECLAEEPQQARYAALVRISDAWLQLVRTAQAHTGAHRGWSPTPDMATAYPGLTERETEEIISDPLPWYDEERLALNTAVSQACEAGLTTTAWGICHHLVEFFELRGQYDDWEHTHRTALTLCQQAADRMGEATTRLGLARCLLPQNFDNALREVELALKTFQELGHHAAEAEALTTRATLLRLAGRHQEATKTLNRARDVAGRAGNNLAAVRAEREFALNEHEQGRHAESVAAMRRSLDRATRHGMSHERATTLQRLAIIKREHGDHAAAFDLAGQALALYRDRGDVRSEAFTLLTRGMSALSLDKPGAASLIRSGLDLLSRLNMNVGGVQTRYVMGRLDLAEGRVAQAIDHLDSARNPGRSSTSPFFLAQVHAWLAVAYRRCGRDLEAHAAYLTARALCRQIGNLTAVDGLDQLMTDLEPAPERTGSESVSH